MASVPYNPVPSVAPQDIGVSAPRVDTPFAAFGGESARAMSSLGSTLEKAGDELFARAYAIQQVNNEAEAREADAQYMMEAGELHANFNALQGRDRVTAFPKYRDDLQAARIKIRDGLKNPMSQKMFDSSSLGTMGRSIFNGAGVAAVAQKDYTIGTATARLELNAKSVEDNPFDENLFRDKQRQINDDAEFVAAAKGLEGPQAELLTKTAQSKAWASRLIGMSKVAPFKALEELEKNKSQLTEGDYLRVDGVVRAQGRGVGASNIAMEVFNPNAKLADMQAEARKKAAELNPNDPLLADHAVSLVNTKYNQAKKAETDEKIDLKQDMADLVSQYRPKSFQEWLQLPGAADIYAAMKPTDKNAIAGYINRYNSSQMLVEDDSNYIRLRGMASSNDPEVRREFLETDPTSLRMSTGHIVATQELQKKLKKDVEADPRVGKAEQIMRGQFGAQLQALGIYSRDKNNAEDYDHYKGTLQSALDAWQENTGQPPKYKDIVDTIGPLLLRQRTESNYIFFSKKVPFYNRDVPEDYKTKARQVAQDPNLSDELIYRDYMKKQLGVFFGPKKKSEP